MLCNLSQVSARASAGEFQSIPQTRRCWPWTYLLLNIKPIKPIVWSTAPATHNLVNMQCLNYLPIWKNGHLTNVYVYIYNIYIYICYMYIDLTYQIIVHNYSHPIIYHSQTFKTRNPPPVSDPPPPSQSTPNPSPPPTAPPKIERNNVVIDLETSWFGRVCTVSSMLIHLSKGGWYEVQNKITSGTLILSTLYRYLVL